MSKGHASNEKEVKMMVDAFTFWVEVKGVYLIEGVKDICWVEEARLEGW
jgi:hypothetical protein